MNSNSINHPLVLISIYENKGVVGLNGTRMQMR